LQAIADTARLVEDGIITGEQARTIEARAREAMVYLGINAILCSGIIAATGGLIAWLGTPASVAVYGLALLGAGSLILVYGSELYRMFGNASALIGGGMLIGGASLELMKTYPDIAGTVMIASGFIVAAAAAWLLKAKRNSARFVTGAILLMGLAMHLVGIGFLLDQHGISGAAISAFYVYATALVVAAGWWVDVRLVTALAIVPFA
jgi:hypothetical protein